MSKKLVSVALSAVTLVSLVGVTPAMAQSATDLQAQIAALLAQIQTLQSQLNTAQGGSSSYTFTTNLTLGSKGAEVKALQQFLNSHGAPVAASGAGSAGNETTTFGPATKAALAKWQAANGISPASGYFGPMTRSKIASMGSSTPGTPSTPSVPAPVSGLSVSVAASNPAAGSLISSSGSAAARVPVLSVNLTAGMSSGVTVNQIKFTKNGVMSDSNISGAYLVENGQVLAQYNSLSGGALYFSSLGLNIAAGQTRTLTLAIDPASGLSAGNTISFSLASAGDVSSVNASNAPVTASGYFPVMGNTFTVTSVSNPAIASLTIASSSIGTSVTAGTQNVIVGAWQFTGANSKVWLKGIAFKVIGSANKTDIRNVKLYVNGAQVGSTLASVGADGVAYFDLNSAPGSINTGSNNVQVIADIMGSPSFNFQFEILNSFDIYAVDSQYNVPIAGSSNTGTQVSINQGQITVTAASDTPTGNVAKSQANVTLAKFSIYAAGEPVKVKWLGFKLTYTGTLGADWDAEIKNLALVDDAGGQVGSTITSPATSATCTGTGATWTAATSTLVMQNCFGNSSSPINYIIPANTTRVLSLKGDVQSGAGFSTVTGALLTPATANLQGMTSSQTNSSGAASGSALTLAASSLAVAANTGIGTPTYAKGSAERKIGSYALTASSAEGVTVSNVTVAMSSSTANNFQNLKVKVGSTQFGQTQGILANSGSYSFAGTPFTVAKGTTVYLDVYADVLSSATAATYATLSTLSGCSASGAVSYSAVSCTSTSGQSVTVAGQATLTVGVNSALTPATGQIVMGATNVTLGAFQFSETSNVDDVKISDLIVFDTTAATSTVKSAFSNMKLYKSTDLVNPVGTAGAANTSASSTPGFGYYYKFSGLTNVVVPQNGSVTLILKGDVASYNSNGATDNTTHIFKIATSTDSDNDTMAGETVNALGNTSNATSVVSLATGSAAPTANTLTVLRTKVTATAAVLGTVSGRAKSATDDFATLTFAADSADQAYLNTLTVTFSGTAPSISTFLDGVTLLDSNGSNVTNSSVTVSTGTACNGTGSCTKTWMFGTTTAGWNIPAGGSYTFKLRIDSTKTLAGSNGVSQSLSAVINANTDVKYTDGLSGTPTSSISLPANVVPLNLNSVSFAAGS